MTENGGNIEIVAPDGLVAGLHGQIQDMRVDNWGNYCLQKLYTMYEKGEQCDLTLQFHNNQILKVHRMVLNLCTEYFSDLESNIGLASGMLVLPEELDYQALSIIIKFFYTGRLEVRGNQFSEVFKLVRILNVTILIKLLEAHSTKTSNSKPGVHDSSFANVNEMLQFQGSNASRTTTHPLTTTIKTPNQIGKPHSVSGPLRKAVTKTVLAKVPHQMGTGKRLPPNILSAANGKHVIKKKLPIWKERKYSPISNTQQESNQKWAAVKDEPARPTRFEWPDPDEEAAHSLTKQIQQADASKDIFDAIKTQSASAQATSVAVTPTGTTSAKVEPISNEDATYDSIEQELAEMEKGKPDEGVGSATNDHSGAKEVKPEGEGQQNAAQLQENAASGHHTTPPDPDLEIIKVFEDPPEEEPISVVYHDSTPAANAKSGSESSMNPMSHSRIISEVFKAYPDLVKDSRNIKLKIVQKNSPKRQLEKSQSPTKEGKSKVSYIILKSTSSGSDYTASPVLAKKTSRLSKRAMSGSTSSFWDPPNKVSKPSVVAADKRQGPWTCDRCVSGEEFESYFNYRKHLVEIHADKIDARICEHCGLKSSKRNLHLYHLYTKHGVEPRNCTFPHCDFPQCTYIGLTDSLLAKHKLMHITPMASTSKFMCQGCKKQFSSSTLLRGHLAENQNCAKMSVVSSLSQVKPVTCPVCPKSFSKSLNLKAHMRAAHKNTRILSTAPHANANAQTLTLSESLDAATAHQILFTTADELDHAQGFGSCQIIVQDGFSHEDDDGQGEHEVKTEFIEATIPPHPPSSEAEAMTNVASSIAASLGLEAGAVAVAGPQHFTTVEGVEGDVDPNQQQTIYIFDSSGGSGEIIHGDGAHEPSHEHEGSLQPAFTTLDTIGVGHGGSFIVQDEDGNKFEQVTAYDEDGKEVVYFQLAQEHHEGQEQEEQTEEHQEHQEEHHEHQEYVQVDEGQAEPEAETETVTPVSPVTTEAEGSEVSEAVAVAESEGEANEAEAPKSSEVTEV